MVGSRNPKHLMRFAKLITGSNEKIVDHMADHIRSVGIQPVALDLKTFLMSP